MCPKQGRGCVLTRRGIDAGLADPSFRLNCAEILFCVRSIQRTITRLRLVDMSAHPTFHVVPDVVADDAPDLQAIGRAVQDGLPSTKLATFIHLPDDLIPCTAFVSRSPMDALRWMCQNISKPKLLKVLNYNYDHPLGSVQDEDAQEEPHSQDANDDHMPDTQLGSKRKREKTTKQVNKDMVDRLNLQLVQTIASTQDWETVRNPEAISVEEQRYRQWAQRLPNAGLNMITHMIKMARAVGTMEVFEDWATIFVSWKRQRAKGLRLFDDLGPHEDEGFGFASCVPSTQLTQRSARTLDIAPPEMWAGLGTNELKKRYFKVRRTHANTMASQMRQRWEMDTFYEEYERIYEEIRRRSMGTGQRGRRYGGVAKEILFALTHEEDLGRMATKEEDGKLWVEFGEYLDWSKRWNILKKRFGTIGIFALLPHSMNPNDWVERKITQARVAQWAEMVFECNKPAVELAMRIEQLVVECVHNRDPPTEYAFLEELHRFQGTDPLALLDSTSRIVDSSTRENSVVSESA